MACCFPFLSIPPAEEAQPLIVDIIPIIQDKAWSAFMASLGSCQKRFVSRKNYDIEVPENYFVFHQVHQSISQQKDRLEIVDEEATPSEQTALVKETTPKFKSPLDNRFTSPELVSVDTEFNNITAKPQTYEFRFSKERKSSFSVSCQKGFSISGKASFSIGMPAIMGGGELGLETEMQYEVTNNEEQAFEETMAMEATSTITVGPDSKYVANVQLDERNIGASFKVVQRMSLPQERAPVYIRRKSDKVIVSVYKINDLKGIFVNKKVPCAREVKEDGKAVKDKVDFVVEGSLKGNLAMNHRINLCSDETPEERRNAKARQMNLIPGDD